MNSSAFRRMIIGLVAASLMGMPALQAANAGLHIIQDNLALILFIDILQIQEASIPEVLRHYRPHP